MIIVQTRLIQTTGIIFMQLAVLGLLLFSGCGGDDATGPQSPQVVDVAISPENAEIPVGEDFEFSAFALTATGDTVDVADLDIEWQWWSDDPDVFTVEPGGMATGHNAGEAYCIVEATIEVGFNFSQKDVSFAAIGFSSDGQDIIQIVNPEMSVIENISSKNRLRFTGRDSAFVMVF